MATVMLMRWEGVTEDQYEQGRWDREVPDGAKLHVAGFSNGGMNVLDVWESAEAFQAFDDQRLGTGGVGDRASPTSVTDSAPSRRRPKAGARQACIG